VFYFAEAQLGALRIDNFKFRFIDQPDGWPGPKVPVNMPIMNNIRQDPFERTQIPNALEGAPAYMNDFMAREFWRFVFVQQQVARLAATAIDFPPMQKPASFNLQAVKAQVEAAIEAHHGQ
jgi:arylsulfatase